MQLLVRLSEPFGITLENLGAVVNEIGFACCALGPHLVAPSMLADISLSFPNYSLAHLSRYPNRTCIYNLQLTPLQLLAQTADHDNVLFQLTPETSIS